MSEKVQSVDHKAYAYSLAFRDFLESFGDVEIVATAPLADWSGRFTFRADGQTYRVEVKRVEDTAGKLVEEAPHE